MIKRILSITLSIILLLGMTGCSDKAEPKVETVVPVASTQEVKTEVKVEVKPEIVPKVVNPDFREVKWGMTREEVGKIETSTFKEDTEKLKMYSDTICGFPKTTLVYEFNMENRLSSSAYMFKQTHSNEVDFITDFKEIQSELIKKYGKPTVDEIIWKDDLYKNTPSDWGMAIITGDLIYQSKWSNEVTEIELLLTGDNYKASLVCFYDSKKIKNDSTDGYGKDM